MTDLTMEQRRADFEDMLKRAARVMDNTRKPKKATPETPGLSLARLADEVAGLCSEWLAAVPRAAAGESSLDLSSAVTRRALTVAAHCLQALTDLEVSKDVAMRDILDAIVSGVDEPFSRPNALDLGIDPRLRVQSLLTNLGGVAKNWPAPLKINAGTKDTAETRQALTLAALACDAVCTAVAAERGLWQADS